MLQQQLQQQVQSTGCNNVPCLLSPPAASVLLLLLPWRMFASQESTASPAGTLFWLLVGRGPAGHQLQVAAGGGARASHGNKQMLPTALRLLEQQRHQALPLQAML